ncbi:MAG: curli-like amyloid fiber formation chaperone CsgH [Pseudomonadota bacterium]
MSGAGRDRWSRRRALLATALGALGASAAPGRRSEAAGDGVDGGLNVWIEVERDGRVVIFRAMAEGAPGAQITYTLVAEIDTGGGISRTQQGGRATLPEGSGARQLSRLSVGLGAGSRYRVTLVAKGDGIEGRAVLEGDAEGQVDL